MKQLIWKPNPRGIGIDVGWRVTDRDGVTVTIKWGNCRGVEQLPSLLADALSKGEEVEDGGELTGAWDIPGERSRS